MKILLVDDSNTMRRIQRNTLSGLGFTEVDEAEDGADAVAKVQAGDYELVLMDWNMPNMTGIEALKAIRANPNTAAVPVIMVNSESEKSRILEAVQPLEHLWPGASHPAQGRAQELLDRPSQTHQYVAAQPAAGLRDSGQGSGGVGRAPRRRQPSGRARGLLDQGQEGQGPEGRQGQVRRCRQEGRIQGFGPEVEKGRQGQGDRRPQGQGDGGQGQELGQEEAEAALTWFRAATVRDSRGPPRPPPQGPRP